MQNMILLYRGADVCLEKFIGLHATLALKFYGSNIVRTEYGSVIRPFVALRRLRDA